MMPNTESANITFIKARFLTPGGQLGFIDGKFVLHNELLDYTPVAENSELFPEIWYNTEHEKIYIFNHSPQNKKYTVAVSELVSEEDILYRDIFTNTVYMPSDGIIELYLGGYDAICLIPHTAMYNYKYKNNI